MAKPKKDADRRAVVEQMRAEAKRKDRMRTLAVLGVALIVGGIIIGFAVIQLRSADKAASRDLSAIGQSVSGAGCQDIITKPAEGNNDHRPEGEKIIYPQAPPAFGPHWGTYLQGAEIRKFYTADDRPPVERLVHSMEHGHTMLWYDETIADDDAALAEVRAIAKKFPSNTDFNDKFIAAPWLSTDGDAFPDGTHVAFTHWTGGEPAEQLGVWQYCTGVSGEALAAFMDEYPYSNSPEPNAP